jgi:hypothetical protein
MTAARLRAGEQALEEQPGQREVAELVGAELELESVGGLAARCGHDARVVDERVDPRMRLAHPRRELAHGSQVR